MLKRFYLLVLFLGIFNRISADEGMWLLPKVHESIIDSMHHLGYRLSSEDIYSQNNPSFKDAVVIFGAGCTGEVVSENGLILTNHHCGYDAIQSLSTLNNDYLKDGYWAKDKNTELPCNDLTVTFLIKMVDVTDSILPYLSDTMTEKQRKDAIESIKLRIKKNESKEGKFETDIRSFYSGNQYYLTVSEIYKDVRLVGAPPNSIGKFGGDKDNWMWPRHNSDFSIFRVYTSPDGSPSGYNEKNIPLKPRKYFTISLNGYSKDLFTFIIGNPGQTNRYKTSSEISDIIESINNPRIKIRAKKQEIMLSAMNADRQTYIQYTSKYARSSNYWKYSIGQNKAIKDLNIIQKEKNKELAILEELKKDTIYENKFKKSIAKIDSSILDMKKTNFAIHYYNEIFFYGIELFSFANAFIPLYNDLSKTSNDTVKIKKDLADIIEKKNKFFKNYNPNVDADIAVALFKMFSENVDNSYKFDEFKTSEKKFDFNFKKYVSLIYKKTFLTDSQKISDFIKKPNSKTLTKDPAFRFAFLMNQEYRRIIREMSDDKENLEQGQRFFMETYLKVNKNREIYPDANSTMRLTYGIIKDYSPSDAVHFNFYTTLKGVIEKEDTSNSEFIVPTKLKELYFKKEYKPYSKTDEMPVCFITDNDISGGNSGSPVLNSFGELIGIAFDGNWEGMAGEIDYNPQLKRTICADIRYILFIIDKFAGDNYILNELKIIN